MREILFRGKRIDNDKWVEGWYQPEITIKHWDGRQETVGVTIDYKTEEGFLEDALVYPSTIGQFTGLNDKNGKRIFEGDILRRAYHPNEDMIVEWHDGRFVFYRRIYPKDYGHESLVCCQQTVDSLAIIGNIHDNSELLEV